MKIINILTEETADDLYRRIASLDAMMNDTATTPNEKESSANLKARLEKRLADKFPNSSDPNAKWMPSQQEIDDTVRYAKGFNNAYAKMAKYDAARKDPTLSRDFIKADIAAMRAERKRLLPASQNGNVVAAQQRRILADKITRLNNEFFPKSKEDYDKMYDAKNKADAKRYEKQVAKHASVAAEQEELGGTLTFNQAVQKYKSAARAFVLAMKPTKKVPDHSLSYELHDDFSYLTLRTMVKIISRLNQEDAAAALEMFKSIAIKSSGTALDAGRKRLILQAFAKANPTG
jgi:hypothetical protein